MAENDKGKPAKKKAAKASAKKAAAKTAAKTAPRKKAGKKAAKAGVSGYGGGSVDVVMSVDQWPRKLPRLLPCPHCYRA